MLVLISFYIFSYFLLTIRINFNRMLMTSKLIEIVIFDKYEMDSDDASANNNVD